MKNEDTDFAALFDLITAARSIQDYLADFNLIRFANSKVTRRAVEREIEIIAEAIKRIRDEFKDVHPEIPWQKIIRQRDMIAHEYDKIQIEKIWLVATESIPVLLSQIEPLIPPQDRLPEDAV